MFTAAHSCWSGSGAVSVWAVVLGATSAATGNDDMIETNSAPAKTAASFALGMAAGRRRAGAGAGAASLVRQVAHCPVVLCVL